MNSVRIDVLFFVVTFAAVVAVRLIRLLALRKVLLDRPNERSLHTIPVPRLGGSAFIPVVLVAVAVGWHGSVLPMPVIISFFLSSSVLFVVGIVDDLRSLPAGSRFAAQIAAAGSFIATGAWVDPVAWCIGGLPSWASCCLWGLWLVGLLNIYNFMDGIDGIAGLQAVIAGLGWTVFAVTFHAWSAAVLAAATAAGSVGFLTLNWFPAKIFMGDAGSTVLGFIFGATPLVVHLERGIAAPDAERLLGVGALLVWPFLVDSSLTITRRLMKNENIFFAHRSHVYQRLVMSGISPAKVAALYGLLAAAGAVAAWSFVQR